MYLNPILTNTVPFRVNGESIEILNNGKFEKIINAKSSTIIDILENSQKLVNANSIDHYLRLCRVYCALNEYVWGTDRNLI